MPDPPDFRVAEIVLELDATPAETLDHLRRHSAVLPVALDGLVPMWQANGWHGTLDGRPVSGSLDRFDEVAEGGILQSASIERHGAWTLTLVVFATFGPVNLVRFTAQAMTQEHADEIAKAAAEAWRRPPLPPVVTTRLERAGRRDSRLWSARVHLRRSLRPTGYVGGLVSGVLVGAFLSVLGFTGWLEDAVRWALNL